VMAAVKENGLALQYASAELKGDREIVAEAVKEADNSVLQFASERLRKKRGGMRKTKNKRRKQKRKTKRSKRRNNKSNKRKTTRR